MDSRTKLHLATLGAMLMSTTTKLHNTLHLGSSAIAQKSVEEKAKEIAHEQRNKFVCLLTVEQLQNAISYLHSTIDNEEEAHFIALENYTIDVIETFPDNQFMDVTCIGDKLCYYLRDKQTFVCAPLHLKTGSIKNVLLSMGLDLATANTFADHFRSCKDAVRNPQFFDLTKC